MKAATGELQLTVITMIAIAAIIGFFWIMWPKIQATIDNSWNDATNTQGKEDYKPTTYIVLTPFEK